MARPTSFMSGRGRPDGLRQELLPASQLVEHVSNDRREMLIAQAREQSIVVHIGVLLLSSSCAGAATITRSSEQRTVYCFPVACFSDASHIVHDGDTSVPSPSIEGGERGFAPLSSVLNALTKRSRR